MAEFRKMRTEDAQAVLEMMRIFYDSPAVLHDVPEETLRRNVKACVSDNPLLEGLVFWEQGHIAGYAMLVKSFSTEFGGVCIWLEDIYVKQEYRGRGIGTQFLAYAKEKYREKAMLLKLEVEPSNAGAVGVYKKCGFEELPYVEMIKTFC